MEEENHTVNVDVADNVEDIEPTHNESVEEGMKDIKVEPTKQTENKTCEKEENDSKEEEKEENDIECSDLVVMDSVEVHEIEEHCSDPEIDAWLNAEDNKEAEEVEKELALKMEEETEESSEEKEEMKEENENFLDKGLKTVIENNSEIPYHDDGDMCILGNDAIAKILIRQMKGKGVEEKDEMLPIKAKEDEDVQSKKINPNSRAAKKAREEKKIAAQVALKAKNEKSKINVAKAPVSKYNYARPAKKAASCLTILAKKQKISPASSNHKEAENCTKNGIVAEKKEKEIDIHTIFNKRDRATDPKLARILYDTSVMPKVSTKPLTKSKEFSFSKRENKK